jgi:hypothetical protein
MQSIRYVYWQDGDAWLGHLEEYPDYLTQSESLADLEEHLRACTRICRAASFDRQRNDWQRNGEKAHALHYSSAKRSLATFFLTIWGTGRGMRDRGITARNSLSPIPPPLVPRPLLP